MEAVRLKEAAGLDLQAGAKFNFTRALRRAHQWSEIRR
jgi:hypothetical protein